MPNVIRWIRWDGFYDLLGVCNRKLPPVQAPDGSGVRLRLRLLGFYDGPVIADPKGEAPDGVKYFKFLTDTANFLNSGPGPLKDTSESAPFLNRLTGLDDRQPAAPAPVDSPLERSLNVSRSKSKERGKLDSAIDDVEPLAVEVISTPGDLNPFLEAAGIQLGFHGYAKIQSLLVRVYREYDPGAHNPNLPDDLLVYQEVLYREDIEALPDASPGPGGKLAYAAPKARLLDAMRRFPKTFSRKEHAPYKFRVWVSTNPDAFTRFEDPNEAFWRRLMRKLGAVSFDSDYEFRSSASKEEADLSSDVMELTTLRPRRRTSSVSLESPPLESERSEPPSTPSAPQPPPPLVVEPMRTVHDQCATNDDLPEPYWTVRDALNVNQMEQICPAHGRDYLQQNAELHDKFLLDVFRPYPVKIYDSLYFRRANKGKVRNFEFPELRGCFENVRRHFNRIRQRLCCGVNCHQTHARFNDVAPRLAQLEQDIAVLDGGNFKYVNCLTFLPRTVHLVEWITFFTSTLPEVNHYRALHATNIMREIAAKRDANKAASDRTKFRAQFEDYSTGVISELQGGRAGVVTLPGVIDGAMTTCSCSACTRTAFALTEREIILVPSYAPLDFEFFCRIRSVPMFALGLIDLDFLLADGFQYSPLQFYGHDLFHAVNDKGGRPQLWQTIQNHNADVVGSGGFKTALEVYQAWDSNVRVLCDLGKPRLTAEQIQKLSSKPGGLRMACEMNLAYDILLFAILHEPFQDIEDTDRNFPPALAEPVSIESRLKDAKLMLKLINKAKEFFFGLLDPSVIYHLETARERILSLLPKLDRTRFE